MLPPVETGTPKHTSASSREPTGGQTRCEEAVRPERWELAERDNVLQSGVQKSLERENCQRPTALRTQVESGKRHASRRVEQKERASPAWSCSTPLHDDRATRTPSNRSTASPVRALPDRRSRMHIPRGRLPARPEELAGPNASQTRLDGKSPRVKFVRETFIFRTRAPRI
jgi:hypothetical protein